MSYARTATLLAALTALFVGFGFAWLGEGGLVLGLLAALALNTLSYRQLGRLIFNRFRTREGNKTEDGKLLGELQHLSMRARLPVPKVHILASEQPNAFATSEGPGTARIAVTEGLTKYLTPDQVSGVLAHELGHIRNRDNLVLTITATVAGGLLALVALVVVSVLSAIGISAANFAIAATIAAAVGAGLVQTAVSRSREFAADRAGAEICGRPLWIATALQEVGRLQAPLLATGPRRFGGTALRFMMASFAGHSLGELISTHPSSSDRIDRLRRLSDGRDRS